MATSVAYWLRACGSLGASATSMCRVALLGNVPIRTEPAGTIPAAPTGAGDGPACAACTAVARHAVVAATLTTPAVKLRAFSRRGCPRIGEGFPSLNVLSFRSSNNVAPCPGGGIPIGAGGMRVHRHAGTSRDAVGSQGDVSDACYAIVPEPRTPRKAIDRSIRYIPRSGLMRCWQAGSRPFRMLDPDQPSRKDLRHKYRPGLPMRPDWVRNATSFSPP